MGDLDEHRARPVGDAVEVNRGHVDDPIGVWKDIHQVGLARELVRRLE